MKRFIHTYCKSLSLLWALVILGLCSMPGNYIPSAGWMDLFKLDKLIHAGSFFTLVYLLLVVVIKHQQSLVMVFLYLVFSIGYGILLELMQASVFSQRSADWQDAVANAVGCVLAPFFLKKIRKTYQVV